MCGACSLAVHDTQSASVEFANDRDAACAISPPCKQRRLRAWLVPLAAAEVDAVHG